VGNQGRRRDRVKTNDPGHEEDTESNKARKAASMTIEVGSQPLRKTDTIAPTVKSRAVCKSDSR
jgi:hypothetical protein